ncbi:hypothetical protein RCH22_003656 [Cryobacterium psychrotolerans]|nr:hypothetical protein [Cryobacterium psychrotolerans]
MRMGTTRICETVFPASGALNEQPATPSTTATPTPNTTPNLTKRRMFRPPLE